MAKGNRVPKNETTILVASAQRGDRAALDALARAYLRPSYLIALGIVRRVSDAEDIAQNALLLALQHLAACHSPDCFASWLFQIVRNQAKYWLAQRHMREIADDSASDPVGREVDVVGERQALLRALSQLRGIQREIVLLHDMEGWKHQEISDALGISCAMSRQQVFLARRILRECLGNRDDTNR